MHVFNFIDLAIQPVDLNSYFVGIPQEQIHFGNIKIDKREHGWSFRIPVYLGEILPVQIRVELYADGVNCETFQVTQRHYQEKITGAVHGYSYQVEIETTRPATDFTARVIPHHPEAQIPAEANLISGQR